MDSEAINGSVDDTNKTVTACPILINELICNCAK